LENDIQRAVWPEIVEGHLVAGHSVRQPIVINGAGDGHGIVAIHANGPKDGIVLQRTRAGVQRFGCVESDAIQASPQEVPVHSYRTEYPCAEVSIGVSVWQRERVRPEDHGVVAAVLVRDVAGVIRDAYGLVSHK